MSADKLIDTDENVEIPVRVKEGKKRKIRQDSGGEHSALINCTNYGTIRHELKPGEKRRVYTLDIGILIVDDDPEVDPFAGHGYFSDDLETMDPEDVPALASDGGGDEWGGSR